jgi:2'-5' RNA ligase
MDRVQLALVIPLADQPAREVTKLQVEILRKYGRNPGLEAFPHITLKMGFGATDIRPFEKYVENLASEIPPFQISIKNFETFEDGILFLDVEPNSALESLRQRILEDLSVNYGVRAELIEGPQFRFHVTLAYGFTSHEFEALKKSYATRESRIIFDASHIDLFCHTGQQWVSYAHSELRGIPKPM